MYDGPFPEVGRSVVYHDEFGVAFTALVTAVHGMRGNIVMLPDGSHSVFPCVNLVYVIGDASMKDQYGRQIVRESSVVHRRCQSAHGRYWRFSDEPVNPVVSAQT